MSDIDAIHDIIEHAHQLRQHRGQRQANHQASDISIFQIGPTAASVPVVSGLSLRGAYLIFCILPVLYLILYHFFISFLN